MRIFDCTTYYDEELMMDIRFNTLKDQVEKFIVVESLFSHSGNQKKLLTLLIRSIKTRYITNSKYLENF